MGFETWEEVYSAKLEQLLHFSREYEMHMCTNRPEGPGKSKFRPNLTLAGKNMTSLCSRSIL
jgi:hypothetical protein